MVGFKISLEYRGSLTFQVNIGEEGVMNYNLSIRLGVILGIMTFIYLLGSVFLGYFIQGSKDLQLLAFYDLWLRYGMGFICLLIIVFSVLWFIHIQNPIRLASYYLITTLLLSGFLFMFVNILPDTWNVGLSYQGEVLSVFSEPPSGAYVSYERNDTSNVAIFVFSYSISISLILSIIGFSLKYYKKNKLQNAQ